MIDENDEERSGFLLPTKDLGNMEFGMHGVVMMRMLHYDTHSLDRWRDEISQSHIKFESHTYLVVPSFTA